VKKLAVLVVAVVLLALPAAVLADPPSPDNQAGREMLGLVPPHNGAAKSGGSGGGLLYHGGPVVKGDKSIAIYWNPAGYDMGTGYASTINGFLTDVAADSGKATNVYWANTQYGDSLGKIPYSSAFRGAIVDPYPFPTTGQCTDTVAVTTVCLTDLQLRTEIERVLLTTKTTTDQSTIVFMFTPRNVGSCYSSSSCAFSSYCAYHSDMTVGGVRTLYANQPYTESLPSACAAGQRPNGNDADSTINVVSHEHNEAITDPLGSAWYDRRGYENGDKCAWSFGSPLGATSYGQYNQTIGTNHYYLQREWSNASSGCVLQGL
jgi:hypothetical protein